MLTPGKIPEKEPLLRVGIVLPEDKKKTITLEIPQPSACLFLVDGKETILPVDRKLNLSATEKGLDISGEETGTPARIVKLILSEPGAWILVNDVVAGRGFHWLKQIPVKLPCTVEIEARNKVLVLVNELPLETYLACVATSEMSAECPDAYIEAQTIVARSWMLANVEQKHVELGIDVCNDDCCQRYQGVNNITEKSRKGALKTSGKVLMWKNSICDARYSKSCGGITEKFENLWGGEPLPYMQNIADAPTEFTLDLRSEDDIKTWVNSVPEAYCSPHYIPEDRLKKYLGDVDEDRTYFRWTEKVTQEELSLNLADKIGIPVDKVIALTPLKRGGSGRLIELEIRFRDKKGKIQSVLIEKDYEIRRVLHKKFLYSSAIVIKTLDPDPEGIPSAFIFRGAGWGHGAGLCQIGALGMSLKGFTAEEIVKHYYPGSELKKIY